MLKYNQNNLAHYQSLGLPGKIHSGFDGVKNSKVGKFVYDPAIEGEALREAGNTVKNVATNIYYSIKEAPSVLKDKEKRKYWWDANKVKVCGLAAFAAVEIGMTLMLDKTLTHYASTRGQGWWVKDYQPNGGRAQVQVAFNEILTPKHSAMVMDKTLYQGNVAQAQLEFPSMNTTWVEGTVQKTQIEVSNFVNSAVNDGLNQSVRVGLAALGGIVPAAASRIAASKIVKKIR